jgi:hypothetical protein
MTTKLLATLALASGLAMAGCDRAPMSPDGTQPQFDARSRTTTTTTTTTAPAAPTQSPATTTGSGGEIGDPCDPATYDGPYHCVPDPNRQGGYVIAT